ncbi:Cleavage and polyadenylation specificity factor subunit 4 [Porphyridium purpureum]|uniref:Cleavage and polyadenylation specificity factor subunit 4 n=1 Tax=Porphyridium purpureum TaxID=35688 RepID=A0A5J4YR05_PORPP|nr:Cleavage and polyadenylation specificity factor subunit 4 [Porphyridium purpureum]|eukprot:POR9034..scf236_6
MAGAQVDVGGAVSGGGGGGGGSRFAVFEPAPLCGQIFKFESDLGYDRQYVEDQTAPGHSTDLCSFFFAPGGSQCDKGAFCQYRHARNDRLIVCKHWLRGLCKKAEFCEYLHEFDMSRMPECFFFSKFGECSNAECQYRHVDLDKKRNECPYYARGFCKHGPKCRHRHVKRVACPNYLAGFCKDGPECQFGHARFEIPRTDEVDDGGADRFGFSRGAGSGAQPSGPPPGGYDGHAGMNAGGYGGMDGGGNRRAPPVCHGCHQVGHIRPMCPNR